LVQREIILAGEETSGKRYLIVWTQGKPRGHRPGLPGKVYSAF